MVHELEFSEIGGVVEAMEVAADLPGVVSCEVETDSLRFRFTTRFPLGVAELALLEGIRSLLRSRCWATPPPVFQLPRSPHALARAIDSSTSMTGIPSSTG